MKKNMKRNSYQMISYFICSLILHIIFITILLILAPPVYKISGDNYGIFIVRFYPSFHFKDKKKFFVDPISKNTIHNKLKVNTSHGNLVKNTNNIKKIFEKKRDANIIKADSDQLPNPGKRKSEQKKEVKIHFKNNRIANKNEDNKALQDINITYVIDTKDMLKQKEKGYPEIIKINKEGKIKDFPIAEIIESQKTQKIEKKNKIINSASNEKQKIQAESLEKLPVKTEKSETLIDKMFISKEVQPVLEEKSNIKTTTNIKSMESIIILSDRSAEQNIENSDNNKGMEDILFSSKKNASIDSVNDQKVIPEQLTAPSLLSQSSENKKSSMDLVEVKENGFVETPDYGNLKIEMSTGEEIKELRTDVIFREFLKERRNSPLTKSEAMQGKKITPELINLGDNKLTAVVKTTLEGIYDFIVKSDNKPIKVNFTMKLYENSNRKIVKNLGTITLMDKDLILSILMPEGILWNDTSYFTGYIEDSESITKFNTDSGLVWKEYKKGAIDKRNVYEAVSKNEISKKVYPEKKDKIIHFARNEKQKIQAESLEKLPVKTEKHETLIDRTYISKEAKPALEEKSNIKTTTNIKDRESIIILADRSTEQNIEHSNNNKKMDNIVIPSKKKADNDVIEKEAKKTTPPSSLSDSKRKNEPLINHSEVNGIILIEPQVYGDLKIEMTTDKGIKELTTDLIFREFLKERRNRPLTKSEAMQGKKITPELINLGDNKLTAVVKTTLEGIYDFIVKSDNEPIKVNFTMKLYENSNKKIVKNLGTITIMDKTLIMSILMPEGILWDDTSYFNGYIEDSESITKFNTDDGFIWREYKEFKEELWKNRL